MRDPHLAPALLPRSVLLLLVALVPPVIASLLGAALTARGLTSWYPFLQKPFFTPPNAAFPLVWTFLYALMAVTLWRILRAKPEAGPKSSAIFWFLVQIALNIGWSWAFFFERSPRLGLVVIGALLVSIAMMIRAFRRIDPPSGYAMMLYLAWVAFAAALNAAIVVLNP